MQHRLPHTFARTALLTVFGLILISLAPTYAGGASFAPAATLAQLPVRFEPNRGQAAPEALFLARGARFALYLKQDGARLALREQPGGNRSVVELDFIGARADSRPTGVDRLESVSSYFRGRDPRNWQTGVPNYARVRYDEIYAGIDLIYYGAAGTLEYDLNVRPGADPSTIRLRFRGQRKLRLTRAGDLEVRLSGGPVTFRKPRLYQRTEQGETPVAGRYVLGADNTVGFEVGKYDQDRTLVIDPVLEYSTFFGSLNSKAHAVAVDAQRNAYITGDTSTWDFGYTPGALRRDSNVFVAKLNSDGSKLLYAATIGGSHDWDSGLAIAVDASGRAYIGGTTNSTDLPVTGNAIQRTSGGDGDGFLLVLNPTATSIVYGTYLGGSDSDDVQSLAVDSGGNVYLVGSTKSSNFPTLPGGLFPNFRGGDQDGFAVKLNSSFQRIYAMYVGGGYSSPANDGDDVATAVAVDASGNAYVTGTTSSADFPTVAGAMEPTLGRSQSAFLTKINPNGKALVFSTFLGHNSGAKGTGVAVDSAGSAYVVGDVPVRYGTDFPVTAGSARPPAGKTDGFAVKFSPDGKSLRYGNFLGGADNESSLRCAVDGSGRLAIFGYTYSSDFPVTADAAQPTVPNQATLEGNLFMSLLSPDGFGLVYSTYLGGRDLEAAGGIAMDSRGAIYVSGITYSPDFVTTKGAYQRQLISGGSSFVVRFVGSGGAAKPVFSAASTVNAASYKGGSVAPGEMVTIYGTSMGPAEIVHLTLAPNGKSITKELAGCRVLFDGVPAPMVYTMAGQLSTVVPYGVAGKKSTRVQVENAGTRSDPVTIPVVATVPGIFTIGATGSGQGAILHWPDYSVNGAAHRIARGGTIMVYATSGGPVSPTAQDGEIVTQAQYLQFPITATIGGVPAKVTYGGSAPSLVAGVLQVNITVPANAPTGAAVPLVITVNGVRSQSGVTVAVK